MGRLDGKSVIVTGASRGIGAEIARVFAVEGGRVVCAARTLREGDHQFEGSLESTVAAIKEGDGEATAVAANISEPEDCQKLVQTARRTYGPIDVLVNNAALTYFVPVKDYPLNRWMRSWAVNFHAPFILSQLVLEDMISCVSPSQVVPTPGTVHHRLVRGLDDPAGEPPELMAKAALVLASEPPEKVSGLVTYSQVLLKQYGMIDDGKGIGFEVSGSGYSQI